MEEWILKRAHLLAHLVNCPSCLFQCSDDQHLSCLLQVIQCLVNDDNTTISVHMLMNDTLIDEISTGYVSIISRILLSADEYNYVYFLTTLCYL